MRPGSWQRAARRAVLAAVTLGVPWSAGFRTDCRAAQAQAEPTPTDLYGIGAILVADGDYPEVMNVTDGGAAKREGHLKAGDHIAGIAEGDAAFVDCKGMTLEKVVNITRGKDGSTIRLQVIPAGGDPAKREVIALVRAELYVTKLAPDDQAIVDKVIKKMAETLRNQMTEQMQKRVVDVVQTAGLDTSGSNAVQNAASEAVDQCLQKAVNDINGIWEAEIIQNPPAQRKMVVKQMAAAADANPQADGKAFQTQTGDWPVDQPAWKEGLKKILTPAQEAAWESAEAKRAAAVEAQIGDFLKGIAQFAIERQKTQSDAWVEQLETDLNSSSDRLDKIKALAATVLNQYGEETRARAEKSLLGMQDDDLKDALGQKAQGFYRWYKPMNKATWDDALAKMLTADETKRLEMAKEDRKKWGAQAMGKLLVALLDEKIAFTAAQREKLEPIAEQLVTGIPDFYFGNGDMINLARSTFYEVAGSGSTAGLDTILDTAQKERWQGLSALGNMDENASSETMIQLPAEGAVTKPEPALDPEATENTVSDYLAQFADDERKALLGASLLRVEDAARTAHLPDDKVERLKTAARGSVEIVLTQWNEGGEEGVRAYVAGATPDTVKQRLASLRRNQFQDTQNAFSGGGDASTVWDKAVKAELSADETKAWQQEKDARAAYHEKAIAGTIIWEFSQQVGLSVDQAAKLEPMVAKILTDYAQDMGGFFASTYPWYLQSFGRYVPIAGIPDKDMKALLTKEQYDRWNRNEEHGQARTYWTEIAQNHANSRAN
jgi:hypothetical protein